jgi:putative peptide zinc metalloprotease protein
VSSALELFSSSWHRVATLRPRLRGHASVERHEYRGELTYVLQDNASRRVHYFNRAAFEIIGLMDAHRTLDQIWSAAATRLGDDAPSQDETIRLLAQLHLADMLQCEVSPDIDELLRRIERQRRNKLVMTLLSPLSIRFPLFDPERLLTRLLPFYRPLFSGAGFVLWLALVGYALVLAIANWPELSRDVTDRILAPHNLLILGLVFPVLKALHEFGHAFAVRRWGGEVHEMGIMLLVFLPVPYVDASASSAFPGKYHRVVVGCAGMLVEVLIAALALFVWVNASPGAVRSIAYSVMFLASVSTLIFNANPLMRFDGYYVLSDLIEIPNLRTRASRYMLYLVERYLFRLPAIQPEVSSVSERAWLIAFALASFAYRLLISLTIALFVAGKYFIVGVVLALWSGFAAFILPLIRAGVYLLSAGRLQPVRRHALAVSAALVAVFVLLLFIVPAPFYTFAEGVIWLPQDGVVSAGTDGFVETVDARPDELVHRGDRILTLSDPVLVARARVERARVEELSNLYQSQVVDQRVRASVSREELAAARAELARTEQRLDALNVTSPRDGRLILPRADDLPAQYIRQGSNLAFVVDESPLVARVLVAQQDVDLVRSRTERVDIKRSDDPSVDLAARVLREVPAASAELPNMALAQEGGGKVALDPRERGGARALQKYFEFELQLPANQRPTLGERVYVRFDHGSEPIGVQWYRSLRQLFLRRLNV